MYVPLKQQNIDANAECIIYHTKHPIHVSTLHANIKAVHHVLEAESAHAYAGLLHQSVPNTGARQ